MDFVGYARSSWAIPTAARSTPTPPSSGASVYVSSASAGDRLSRWPTSSRAVRREAVLARRRPRSAQRVGRERFRMRTSRRAKSATTALASPIEAEQGRVGVVILLTEELEPADDRRSWPSRAIQEPLDELTELPRVRPLEQTAVAAARTVQRTHGRRRRCAPSRAAQARPTSRPEDPAGPKGTAPEATAGSVHSAPEGVRPCGGAACANVKRVCLAYSGGLDTSVILHWLIETLRLRGRGLHGRRGSGGRALGLPEKAKRPAPSSASSATCARSSSAISCFRRSAATRSTRAPICWERPWRGR